MSAYQGIVSGAETFAKQYFIISVQIPNSITAVLTICYVAISLVAIIGNSLVMYVVCVSRSITSPLCTVLCKTILILRRMQTVTNFYIANLAMSDVVLALFCIPFQFRAALMQRWDLPEFMCQFCPFMQTLSVCNNDKLLVLNMIKTR